MNILAVDTTGDDLSLALRAGGRRFSVKRSAPKGHDQILFDGVDRLLARARLKLSDLDAIAAARGPGRFTGIRVGMAFAAVAASRLGAKALAISLLEAAAFRRLSAPLACVVVAGVRDEKYYQVFHGRKAGPPAWVRAEDWDRVRGELEARGAEILDAKVDAADLLAPAAAYLKSRKLPKFEPLYLKPATFEKLKP